MTNKRLRCGFYLLICHEHRPVETLHLNLKSKVLNILVTFIKLGSLLLHYNIKVCEVRWIRTLLCTSVVRADILCVIT